MRGALIIVMSVAAVSYACPAWAARERFQCSIENEAAAGIIDLRDRGHPKQFVLAPLPPRDKKFSDKRGTLSARLAVQMYSIIDDVYAHPDTSAAVYLAYRNAACVQRNAGHKVPFNFAEVALPMGGCQSKHGQQASPALTQCATDVIEYYQRGTPSAAPSAPTSDLPAPHQE